MKWKPSLAFFLITLATPVPGMDLVTSDFTGDDLSNHLPVATTSHLAGTISVTGWAIGAGLDPITGFDNRIAFRLPSANAIPSTLEESISRDEYLTFTVIPNSPITLAGQRMTFGVTRNSWFAARRYSVFTNIEGFASESALFTSDEIPNGEEDEVTLSFIFASSPEYENLTDPIEIRIYAHEANYSSHVTSLSAFSITDPGTTFSLNVSAANGGTISISPDGGGYTENSPVVLTAVPPEGFRFLRWGGTQLSELNPLHVLMDRDHSLSALFENDQASEMRVGTNLSQIASWSSGQPFTDLMKFARSWVGRYPGGLTQPVPAGVGGYPLEVPFDVEGVSHYSARARIPHFSGGDHLLSFEGTGVISFSNGPADGSTSYSGSGSLSTHTVPLNAPPSGNLFINIDESDPSDPVRNISVHLPGYDATTTFSPAYVETLQTFSCLRFMDWARTNSNPVSTWEERNTPNYYTQGVTVEDSPGVALEYMIQLSNETQKSPWFCIPHLADDDYVTQAAQLIRDTLDPDLSFYLEYSNETWNGAPAFIQTYYARAQGVALGLDENPANAGHLYHSLRSAQIWQIFAEVFASDDPTRVINTMASWSARDEISELRLNALSDPSINPTGIAADVLAIAPYFGGGIDSDELAEDGYPTAAEIVGPRSIAEIAETRLQVRDQKQLARLAGVQLVCYEGGQHWVGSGAAQNDEALLAALQAANRDPAMEDRYTEYLDMLRDEGVEMYANFQHIAYWSRFGSWSIWEYQGQPLDEAPKARAILNWIENNSGEPELPFQNWKEEFGIDPSESFTSDLESDSVPLLAEYAFNMNPLLPDFTILNAGSGLSGSPSITFQWDQDALDQGRLVVEYIRRRNDPQLSYLVEFSNGLAEEEWQATASEETIHVINDAWERVLVRDETTSFTATMRFGRVSLVYDSP